MNSMESEINKVIEDLNKFSSKVVDIRPPVSIGQILRFEKKFQIKLPADYKYLLSKTNGFNLMGHEVCGITWQGGVTDLVDTYQFEHFEVIVPQYKYLIPFSPDGGGNFYCFDTRINTCNNFSNPVVFWYSNYEYVESDSPEIVYECLADYMNSFIHLTLEHYNYDGSKVRYTPKTTDDVKDGLKIEISIENKIDRGLLNPPLIQGNAPTFKENNNAVEIHYEGQYPNGVFKEMSREEHRGRGGILY